MTQQHHQNPDPDTNAPGKTGDMPQEIPPTRPEPSQQPAPEAGEPGAGR